VLNEQAVRLALRAALALGCEVRRESVFARKNYFYPDLPKGYQISQYDRPIAEGGAVPIEIDGAPRSVGLIRLHLEEDAGKLLHDVSSDEWSHIDLNRAGVPLVEIVSRPELGTPEEAYLFLQRLRSILRYAEVCDGNMERGSLRCDANVSIRPVGSRELGTRTEVKNLNSFRNVQRALAHEIERQTGVVESGGRVAQETVLWDVAAGETRPTRGKEEAQDYRYFPDPDLPPLVLDPRWIDEERDRLPELPAERKQRLAQVWGLSEYEADLLTLEAPRADLFERVAEESGNARAAAGFILNDLLREQRAAGLDESEIPIAAGQLSELIRLVDAGTISGTVARQELFRELCRSDASPARLVAERGLEQVSDESELSELVRSVVDANPEQVRRYRAGKSGLLGYFVGEVMKASRGKANPRKIRELLDDILA
jgi:aspartyl-tRNA(Asn)/glutamyl-tRNA(Gln) amidotransferase subunit B